MLNLTRQEIKTKIHELYRAAREPLVVNNKADLSPKEFRQKIDQGYTWDQYVDDFGKARERFELPGIQRYDEHLKISSGRRYPRELLDLVGGSREAVSAFNSFDQAISDFSQNIEKETKDYFLKDIPYRHIDESKLDWNWIYKHVPRYQHHYVDLIKESLDEPVAQPTFDHILELFDDEHEELLQRYDKYTEHIKTQIQCFEEEIQRTYDFYEKLPTMTAHDLFEMDPELFQLALDDFERKIDTVAWDPMIEPTPEQTKEDDFIKAAFDLKTLPELPN